LPAFVLINRFLDLLSRKRLFGLRPAGASFTKDTTTLLSSRNIPCRRTSMMRRGLLAILVLTALAGSASAQTTLEWKFFEGQKFFLEQRTDSNFTVTVLGMETTEKQNQQIISSFVVKTVEKDSFVLEQRVESWKLKSSKDMDAENPAVKALQTIFKDVVLTVRISRPGKVLSMDGYDQLIKNVDGLGNEQEAQAFKNLVSEKLIRSWATLNFDVFPEKAVNQGDSWRKDLDIPVPALGNITIASEFTLGDKRRQRHTITFKDTFDLKAGGGEIQPGVKLVDFKATKNQSKGKMIFDAAEGHVVVLERSLPLNGTMVFSANGMEIEAELISTETRTTTWHDEKPPFDK
jgi:Family of unknown function (DUF6263)